MSELLSEAMANLDEPVAFCPDGHLAPLSSNLQAFSQRFQQAVCSWSFVRHRVRFLS